MFESATPKFSVSNAWSDRVTGCIFRKHKSYKDFLTFTDLHSLPKICRIKRAAMRKSWYSLLPITFDKTLNITCVWISLEWNRVSQKSQLIFWNNLLWNWQIISVDFTFIFHIHKSISAIIHYMSVDSIDKHLN